MTSDQTCRCPACDIPLTPDGLCVRCVGAWEGRDMSRNGSPRFRDTAPGSPHNRCARCGNEIDWNIEGRPRKYCSEACRRAGARLRARVGRDWYMKQPWYPTWEADQERKREEHEQKRAEEQREREEQRRLVESMPPDVRKAYEAKKKEQDDKFWRNLAETTVALDVANLNEKHAEILHGANKAIRLIDGSRTVEKLLRSAVMADNEREAQAMFAKAREIVARGLNADDVPFMAEEDLIRHTLRTWRAGS